jgi:Zn-dependent peptidase ImmA (M78 family)/transcriptional regulator with XRE-family HTH domain
VYGRCYCRFVVDVLIQPETLALVRTARGYTQVELAHQAGLSQGLLSRVETGAAQIDEDRARALAAALNVPTRLLARPSLEDEGLSACVFHRKRNALPVSKAKQIRSILDLARIQVTELVAGRLPDMTLERVSPTADGYVSPEDIARSTRKLLSVPEGPIQDLVALIESAGVLIMAKDLGTRHLDAISSWPGTARPMVLLNSMAPGDRQRFTLAHELGHAIMHQAPGTADEDHADRFASDLLMPSAMIRAQLHAIDMGTLTRLKRRWGVSMAALVRRARDLGTINDYQYKQLNIEFSKSGYRTREPEPMECERPRLVTAIVDERRRAGESLESLADMTYMSVEDFTAEFAGGAR